MIFGKEICLKNGIFYEQDVNRKWHLLMLSLGTANAGV
jgi:hypothetical protein